jgi:hypothetical protein
MVYDIGEGIQEGHALIPVYCTVTTALSPNNPPVGRKTGNCGRALYQRTRAIEN